MNAMTLCIILLAACMATMASATRSDKKLLVPELYFKKHSLMIYVQDAVALVLRRREEAKPLAVLAEYFKSVKLGTHVAFREYSYVASTPYNRASFLKLFWGTYAQMAKEGSPPMKAADYLSLLRLLCPDFHEDLLDRLPQSIRIGVTSFSDFVYAFQVPWYYQGFLERCVRIYAAIQDGHRVEGMDRLVQLSTQTFSDTTISVWPEISVHHAVDVPYFGEAIMLLACDHLETFQECSPSVQTLQAVLGGNRTLTFDQFVLRLCTSDCVNSEIGILPPRTEFVSASQAALHSIS